MDCGFFFVGVFFRVMSVDKLESATPLPLERRTASQTRYLRRAGPHDSTASSPFPWQLSVVLQRGAGEKEEGREGERDRSSPRLFRPRHLQLHQHGGLIEFCPTDTKIVTFAILHAHPVSYNSFFYRLLQFLLVIDSEKKQKTTFLQPVGLLDAAQLEMGLHLGGTRTHT